MKRATRISHAFDLGAVREAYRLARFSDAAGQLDAAEAELRPSFPADAALLRARIYLLPGTPMYDPAAALGYLSERVGRFSSKAARAEAALLEGAALVRLNDQRAAAASFKTVGTLVTRGDPLELELAYWRALSLWIARKLDAAERAALELAERVEGKLVPYVQVLRGFIAASRGDVMTQGAIMLEALREVRGSQSAETIMWALIASQIAFLARDLPSTALRDAAYAEIDAVPWTPDLDQFRFAMLQAIGWRYALEGDYFNAFRRLKESSAAAPSDAWRTLALCDRAYLATCLGERRWAEQELSDARELAARVEWNALDGEERFALSMLAELCAPHDPALALSYVARYKAVGKRYALHLVARGDRRVDAFEAYAFGIVQMALGNRSEAARLLREAWNVYAAIGYDWQAGRTARALGDLTGDAIWRKRAAEKLVAYPRSWLVTPPGATPQADPPEAEKLTPAQRAV